MPYPAVSPPRPGVIATWLKWYSYASVLAVAGFVLFVFFFAFFGRPKGRRAEFTEAVNNARQVGMALFQFRDEYGQMPDAGTIDAVRKKSATDLHLGSKSSNDFFRQLLASGIAQSEPMFNAKVSGNRKSDGIITGASALAKGECGFTYFTGATKDCGPSRPIIATPAQIASIPGPSMERR